MIFVVRHEENCQKKIVSETVLKAIILTIHTCATEHTLSQCFQIK